MKRFCNSGWVALVVCFAMLGGVGGCASAQQEQSDEGVTATAAVALVLDALHEAAAAADEESYFELFAPDAVFLGTDPGERWTIERFRAFAHPHFARGTGWTYHPRTSSRHVDVESGGGIAWFDEALDNDKYGECRGTGVLRKVDGSWRIVQYSLSIPIPNDLSNDVVQMIRGSHGAAPTG